MLSFGEERGCAFLCVCGQVIQWGKSVLRRVRAHCLRENEWVILVIYVCVCVDMVMFPYPYFVGTIKGYQSGVKQGIWFLTCFFSINISWPHFFYVNSNSIKSWHHNLFNQYSVVCCAFRVLSDVYYLYMPLYSCIRLSFMLNS